MRILGKCFKVMLVGAILLWTFVMNVIGVIICAVTEG